MNLLEVCFYVSVCACIFIGFEGSGSGDKERTDCCTSGI